MKLSKINIPKVKLDTLPKEEQILFVQLGRLLNELNILQKCAIFSRERTVSVSEAERRAQIFQTLFFIRMLAISLNEGWEMLRRDFFGKKLSRKYDEALSEESRDSLSNLKKYFGKENLVYFVRNQFAAHYLGEQIEKEIGQISQNEALYMYISGQLGNCLFSFAEVMVNRAILNYIDASNSQEAMHRLVEQIALKVTDWFKSFASDCIRIVYEKLNPYFTEVEITEPPFIDEVKLPYFVRRPQ
jgi:hypothetical protein